MDSLFQFPSFYHGEKMWKILFSELVHEAAVQGGFRLVFLRRSDNSDKTIVQYTITRFMGKTRKKRQMPAISRGNTLVQTSSMLMVSRKRQLREESMKGAFWMEGYSHGEDTPLFLLTKKEGALSG